ncbi:hypothetical protein [Laribacter hongkongensis]|uniref:hypothetical protein n=1 Tax=Laribacter hongkongensis TaxID=168471 RepID=UPI00041AC3CB|nr:hypothetical protein [Laribacter hongkongensis]
MKTGRHGGMRRLLVAGVAVVLLAGCATSRLTSANYARINDGMDRADVVAILGEPAEMVSGSLLGEGGGGAVWRQGDTVIVIQFAGDRVAGKQIVKGRAVGLLDWLE